MSDRETILSGLDDDQRKVVEADASRRTRADRREHEDEPSRQERKRLGEASITVYTVHTAKGRDFDEAWLCGDTIASALECCDLTSAEQIEEARVAYVALTRSKGPTYVLPTIPAASDAPSPLDRKTSPSAGCPWPP